MKPFKLQHRIGSFQYAFEGILFFFKTQHNAIIHLFATVFVIALGLFCHLSINEWLFIALATGFVWSAEIFNTAIEAIMDHLSPEIHSKVKLIKDLSAAAVLVAAVTAVVVAAFIFIPKLF